MNSKNKAAQAIRLLHDNVLVQMEPLEHMSKGIWIPGDIEAENNALYKGTVLATGPGKRDDWGKLIPTQVVPGDKILFPWALALAKNRKHPGPDTWGGPDQIIMSEADVRLRYA